MQEREDHLIQCTIADATIRLLAAVTTNLVNEACGRHGTSPTASAALGRTLTGALLLGRSYKDLEYITLRFDCKGEIGGITAEASAHGTVRGYVKNPLADAPLNAHGKLDVRGIVGGGMFHVIREAGYEIGLVKDPYQGSVPIVSGEIAEDLAHYLLKSEQINSAVSLGVFLEPEQGRVTAAGGYLIQVMPGADAAVIEEIENAIANAPHEDQFIELHIRQIPGGEFTNHVFNEMRDRAILRFEGPHGTFFLREDSDKPIIFMAGGTGFAPIKSVVSHALHNHIDREMVLYWGCRRRADLYLNDWAESAAATMPQLRYVPVLSESFGEGWSGRTGLVHRAVIDDFPDLSAHQVYACGTPVMVDSARHDFVAHCALPAGEFYADNYYDPEVFIRGRILALIDYINRMQAK